MRNMKDKLREIELERHEWQRSVGIDLDSGERKIKYAGRPAFVQVDMKLYSEMFDSATLAMERIARMILSNLNFSTNIYCGTFVEISEQTRISLSTVERTMVSLQQIDFIRKYKNGRWMVNPAVAIGCSFDYFHVLMDRYYSLRPYSSKKKGKESTYENRQSDGIPESK